MTDEPKDREASRDDPSSSGGGSLAGDVYRLVARTLGGFPDGHPSGAVVVAVSGGCDSMALLELLAEAARSQSPAGRFQLHVAYVDHGQRAGTAREAALVASAAARHEAAFARLDPDPPLPAGASEATMRAARYRVLQHHADRVGAHWIATGHTRDDQTETLLMRLLRGSGRLGLGGIRPVRGRIVRPLLDLERAELERFLRARGVGWIDDASNGSTRYLRNRLRHVVLPTIESAIGRGSLRHLPDVAARLRIEEDYLIAEARRFARYAVRKGAAGADEVDLIALERVPTALRGRVLRDWFASLGPAGPPTIAQLAALERLAAGRAGTVDISLGGLRIERAYERLRLAAATAEADAFAFDVSTAQAGRFEAPSGSWRVTVDPQPNGRLNAARSLFRDECDVDAARLRGPLVLRPVDQGDTIVRSGRGVGKVRDIMVDLRVPRNARRNWPVLADAARIVWVPGVAVAAETACCDDHEGRVRFAWHRRR